MIIASERERERMIVREKFSFDCPSITLHRKNFVFPRESDDDEVGRFKSYVDDEITID